MICLYSKELSILTVEFAENFHSKLVELFQPKHEITYWTFYAVVIRYEIYETIFDKVCDEHGLTEFFSFKNDLCRLEKDKFFKFLTNVIVGLLKIPEGNESDYMEKF